MLIHCGTKQIDTERLTLRKFDYSDAEDMLEFWISDPKIQFLYSEPIYTTKKDVNKLLSNHIASYEKEDYYHWAIIEKKTNYCIGQISFFSIDTKNHYGEIKYGIGRKFQNKGYATEATKVILEYGFNKINLHKVQISHKKNNLASKAIINKLKFKYEGTLRDHFFVNGHYIDRPYYSMIKKEYESIKKDYQQ
jgi:RimJ/RimL family protein N-acetyltransferase